MWKENPDLSSGLTEFFPGFWKNRNKKACLNFDETKSKQAKILIMII